MSALSNISSINLQNVRSFGIGAAKGISKNLTPIIYTFSMIEGRSALGFTGLLANCLSVGLGAIDATKGVFQLTNNSFSLGSQRTSFSLKSYKSIAQNIHRVVIGLAMVNSIFTPSSLTNAIIGTELLRHGIVNALQRSPQMQKSLNKTPDGKRRDWFRIGEAMITMLWAVYIGVNGVAKLAKSNALVQKKITIELNSDAKDKHAVEMIGLWDPNKALDPSKVRQMAREDLRDIYTVYSSIVTSDQEVCDVLNEARKMVGKPLDAAYLGAHGNVRGIILNEGQTVTTASVEKIAGCLKETLAQDAPIFLFSCSSAKTRTGNRLSFAERLAGETGHPIYAPTHRAIADECRILENHYTEESPKPIFSCIRKTRGWEFVWKTPPISNSVTSNVKEYNRFIERLKDERDERTVQEDWLFNVFYSKVTALVPGDVWQRLAHTDWWQDLNKKWWEKVG